MTINWRPCWERPKDGQEIWVLKSHWKGYFPSSFEICAGEVESTIEGEWRVNSCDYDGGGSNCSYPLHKDNSTASSMDAETFCFWCEKNEITVPKELIREKDFS